MALKETGVWYKEYVEEPQKAGCGCVTVAILIGAGIYALPVLLQAVFPILVIIGIVWLIKKFVSK